MLNLFHALISGDSRERPAFDWRKVPDVDPDEVREWFGVTDAKSRQFPLQLALQVHDELEREMMRPEPPSDARLREIRGGLAALSRFARLYNAVIQSRGEKDGEDA